MQHNLTSTTQLANDIVERVLQRLAHLGRIPRHFTPKLGNRAATWTLSRTTNAIVGREHEIELVQASLRRHGAAVI